MASSNVFELLRGEVIKGNKIEVERMLNEHEVMDLVAMDGREGNLINIAIERADVDVLALLLGLRYPIDECITALSYNQYVQINSVCDDEGMTPLMKAVKLHKCDMVELLLTFGANVNYYTEYRTAAIDYTNDPNILCLLFEHDSKFSVGEEKLKAIKDLISKDCGKLKELFLARDKDHESLKGRDSFDLNSVRCEMKTAIMRGKYYVNSQGQSLLYSTLENKKFCAWANLLDLGMEYVTLMEKQYEKHFEKECNRALADILVPLEDCHLIKLAAKSYNPRSMKHWKKRNHVVLDYFKHMNGHQITKTLMEVVQDVPGFHIVFDFENTSIKKIQLCQSEDARGITEIERFKISVAAKKNEKYGFPEIVSNIVHELCHLAMVIVYKKKGLPYKTDDEDRKKLYEAVMEKVRCSEGCDEIIRKAWKYPTGQQGMELIVRVPEIISKYQGSVPDGSSRLKEQAEALLDFYEEHVQPDLEEYVDGFSTSQRIIGRGLIEYQELFLQADEIQVSDSIEKDIMDFIEKHNDLKVAKVSNLKIAQSHLKLSLIKNGKPAPFFVDWSFYIECRDFLEKCLTSGEIDTLAISWDKITPPSFCKYKHCRGNCLRCSIGNFEDKIFILFGSEWKVPMRIKSLEYSWDDLAKETKNIIKEREIKFNGKLVKLKTLISGEGDSVDEFYRDHLDSKGINLILDGGDIVIGRSESLDGGRVDNKVLQQPKTFIPRRLTQSYVVFNEDLLRRFKSDIFCVGNIEISCLRDLGISEGYMKHWEGETTDSSVQCLVLQPISHGKNEESVTKEILDNLRRRKQGKTLHYLKYRRGMFALVRSLDIQQDMDDAAGEVEGLLSTDTFERLLETSAFQSSDPLLVADNPGTGKSTYLHSVAEEIMCTFPHRWVSFIDLGVPEQQKHLLSVKNKLSFSQEEVFDSLFHLVRSGGKDLPLERKIFDEFCAKKNKIIIILDGFDEICPRYKSIVTLLIVALHKVKDDIKLLISTRLHEKLDLEEELGVISHELVAFSQEDQLDFLYSYWNELLNVLSLSDWQHKMDSSVRNFERWVEETNDDDICNVISVIKGMLSDSREKNKLVRKRINLKPIASRVLMGLETLFTVRDGFMETPLHLQMIAFLIFHDSFDLKNTMNLGHLYQRFFNVKMKIQFWEKSYGSDNLQAESTLGFIQETMTEKLEKLSVNLMDVGLSFEEKDIKNANALNVGLLCQKGEFPQFIHRTFTEFFFASWMLKEAGRSDVTKLWIECIFVDERFARVRKFIEDILHILSEGSGDFEERGNTKDFFMLEKAKLDKSVLINPSQLQNSIYCIVQECNIYTLQYLGESFGKNVAKMVVEKFNPSNCCEALEEITSTCRRHCYFNRSGNKHFNAFSFATFCLFKVKESKDYGNFIKKMLDLVKENEMQNEFKQYLLTNGVNDLIFLPFHIRSSGVNVTRNKEVLSILLENEVTLGDILREWMTQVPSYSNTFSCRIFHRTLMFYPHLVHLVVESLYDKGQLKSLLMKEGIISSVWIETARKSGLEETEKFWSFIRDGLEMDKTHLRNYLEWKGGSKYNALLRSACNEDTGVIEWIWELADDLMNAGEEKKKWLFDSFDCEAWKSIGMKFSQWSFHKFLARRVNSGFLSGDEMLHLLKSTDVVGECYILWGYPYSLFTHIFPIHHNIKDNVIAGEMCINYFLNKLEHDCFTYHSSLPLNEHLEKAVDNIFEEVRSCDTYGLADVLEVDEDKLLVAMDLHGRKIHQDRFKFFVAALFKQIHFCKGHVKKYVRVKCLMDLQEKYKDIYHVLTKFFIWESPLLLGYVFIILLDCLPRDDILDVLLQTDEDRKTIFHNIMEEQQKQERNFSSTAVWNKLSDVAMALLGKDPKSTDPSDKFIRHNVPESREELEEILTEWKMIWEKRQKEEKAIGETSTDTEKMDEDQGEYEMDKDEEKEEMDNGEEGDEADEMKRAKRRRLM